MFKKITKHPFVLNFLEKYNAFKESKRGKTTFKVLTYSIQAAIFVFLIYQLTKIGWLEVLKALPINPLFYILLIIHYFVLPISEQYIYRLSLKFTFWEGLKVFVKKKILNTDVYVYSGEAFFYIWAKKNLKESDKEVFNALKDNNIISSIASTFMAAILLLIFLYFSQDNILDSISISKETMKWSMIGGAILLPLIAYLLRFLISMPMVVATKIFVIHLFRFIVTYALEVLQWIVVLPEVPLHLWFVYLGSKMILNRIPIPSLDLAFLPVSIAISDSLGVDDTQIAALMLAVFAANRVINITFYSLLSIFDKDSIQKIEENPTKTES